MCVVEGLTSSLLTNAFRNRFILPQLLRPMLPDESMTKLISAIGLHSFSRKRRKSSGKRYFSPIDRAIFILYYGITGSVFFLHQNGT